MLRGIKIGGEAKIEHFDRACPPLKVFNNQTLRCIVEALHLGCHRSYKEVDHEQMQALYGISNPGVEEKADGSESGEEFEDEEIVRPCLDDLATSTSTHRDLVPSPSFLTMVTEPSSRTTPAPAAADPCELQEFLSHHGDLHRVFLSYQGKKARMDKHNNQFVARAGENPIPVAPRAQSSNIGTMSMTTGSDLVPDLGRDVRSSSGILSFSAVVSAGKRHREEVNDSDVKDAKSDDGLELAQSIAKRIKTGEASSSGGMGVVGLRER